MYVANVVGRCLSCGDRFGADERHYVLDLRNRDPYEDGSGVVFFCYTCGTQLINVVMESEPRPLPYGDEKHPLSVQFAIEVARGQGNRV